MYNLLQTLWVTITTPLIWLAKLAAAGALILTPIAAAEYLCHLLATL